MNALAHRMASATVLSAIALAQAQSFAPQQRLGFTMAGGAAGYAFALLPDVMEPATSPNHRRFFHSVAFGAVTVIAARQLYQWQPENDGEALLRWIALAAAGAYIVRLLLDATTTKSLPLIGK